MKTQKITVALAAEAGISEAILWQNEIYSYRNTNSRRKYHKNTVETS
jgi:hypothetical protein